MAKKNEIDEEVEKLDQSEHDDAQKKSKDNLLICPKCKTAITEDDFEEDKFSEIGTTSIESKIRCPKCGYTGMPIEISKEEYTELKKK